MSDGNPPKKKKNSEFEKFLGKIFQYDIKDAGRSVVDTVIVPEIKNALSNTAKSFVDSVFYGKPTVTGNRNYPGYPGTYISYNNIRSSQNYQSNQPQQNQGSSQLRPAGITGTRDLTFDDRGEAETILAKMRDQLATYGSVSVMDFYEFSGCTNVDPSTYNWGWTNLDNASVKRDGIYEFYIDFPNVVPLNK